MLIVKTAINKSNLPVEKDKPKIGKGETGMKRKLILFAILLLLILSLTACEVHYFDKRADVSWWVIAIPTVIVCVIVFAIAHVIIVRKQYRCPVCRTVFRPKWHEISAWLHDGDRRVMKCPHCGRRGFCPPADD